MTASDEGKDTADSVAAILSKREKEVLYGLVKGKTNSSIAREMNLSPHTVDTYLRRIREKTGISNRAKLILLGAFFENGGYFED
jgi:DNA-binding CsgD family transcriptional regulator